MDDLYDIAVIGGGAGGLFAASVARGLGAKTCLVEKHRLGGDCTWYGCVPSKAILRAAAAVYDVKALKRFGMTLPEGTKLDTKGALDYARRTAEEIATHHEPEEFEKRGIDVLFGPPRFTDPHTMDVGADRRIRAKRFILCTGSHPLVPQIEGLADIDYLTNENIFELKDVPESLIVLGGGPIGCELAQAFCRLGSKVTLVEMQSRILGKEDPEMTAVVEDQFRREGMDVLTGWTLNRFCNREGRAIVRLQKSDGQTREITSQKVLVAVGRAPNVDGLDLEKAGVAYTSKGLTVNAFLQTTAPHIFACGDLASPYQFSHVAAYQAAIATRNALLRRIAWAKVNYHNMAWATFTHPEISHLGLTEDEARGRHRGVRVYTTPYTNVDRSVTDAETAGLMKVIPDRGGRILGAHVAGAQAGEIIQGLLVAKSQGMKLRQLTSTLFIYPTLSELVKKTAAKPLLATGDNPLVKALLKFLRDF